MSFVHLHNHTHYSLLDGLPKIPDLIAKVKKENMPAVAITDHGVMSGAIELYQHATKNGIKPIIGCEVYVATNGRLNKRAGIDNDRRHLTLLAATTEGYHNLLKLTSAANMEGYYYKPRIDLEILQEYSKGLIGLSGCLNGEISKAILKGEPNKIQETIAKYHKIFGDGSFYLEVQPHVHLPEQLTVNQVLKDMSKEMGIPLVGTNDCHYLHPEDEDAQDVLLCIALKKKVDDPDRMCMKGENLSFRPAKEMIKALEDFPDAAANTLKIAEKCNVEIELGKVHLPHYDVPKGKSAQLFLRELCEQAIPQRYGPDSGVADSTIKERLDYELSIIEKTGYASYFLIVQDFVNWAKAQNIMVGPGRGSAAGSIVSYLLNITNLDPIKYELVFERFLNPERIAMPDIDLDFADTRRDEVLKYVEEKYGRDHVAQIITFGTMAARAAIRDVGRVLDYPYNYCDEVAKMIPQFSNLDEALETPDLKQLYQNDKKAQVLIDTAKKLEGVARHASTHACGVLITKDPLTNYVPVQYASSSDQTLISQYSLHPVEDLGLLKMDFLGLKNLTILEQTLEIVDKGYGKKINIDDIPLTDKKAFQLLKKGNTTGVFQLESAGMKRYLKKLKPTELEDIIAMVALYRPGPMELIPDFIAGKHGKKVATYLHPKLKPILEKTHGIAVYQEQVLQMARDLAGFTLGEADVLRKAVGKKIASLLAEQREKFIKGCIANGIDQRTAEDIFAFIEPFAGYGFNRAHAACYAMIAYQTAFLKANFPTAFMAALLTADQGDTERVAGLVIECRGMGITVLPPDINESFKTFTAVVDAENPTIRFGLLAIKNVGENIVSTIITERRANGPYKSLEDFLTRVQSKDLNKKSLDSLVKCGALDRFADRNQMLLNMDQLLSFVKAKQMMANTGQTSLFGAMPEEQSGLRLKEQSQADKYEMLAWEKELLGLYITEHPLDRYADILDGAVVPLVEIKNASSQQINVAGVLAGIKKIITKKGEAMLFAQFDDAVGRVELIVFPRTLQDTKTLWEEGKLLMVKGKRSTKDGEIKVIVESAYTLNSENDAKHFVTGSAPVVKSKPVAAGSVTISLPTNIDVDTSARLKNVFTQVPGPYRVHLLVQEAGQPKRVATQFSIANDEGARKSIESVLGAGNLVSFVDA